MSGSPMRKITGILLCLCLILTVITACGGNGNNADRDGKLNKYVEFRSVSGYYDGQKYSVELPYFIGESNNVLVQTENKNIAKIAEKIKHSSLKEGYQVSVSCVLTKGSLISVRLKGNYDKPNGKDSDIWATNYNVTENTFSSIAALDFPYSDNYEGWIQHYINERYKKSDKGITRVYNCRIPYLYYVEGGKLMSAVVFTKLNDNGKTMETVMEIDITDGPSPYFTKKEMQNIGEVTAVPDRLPPQNSTAGDLNDEYAIKVSYSDNRTNEFVCRLFYLGQKNPKFPEPFDALDLKITYEPGANYGGDYTKTYTFTDARGYKDFVLKTQYWGEKDWDAGIEEVCYIGVDSIDGIATGTIRGSGGMSEEELLILYPHDLYLATKMIPGAHAALNLSNPSKTYIYKDPKDKSNRDLAFIVKDGQVISVDTAASYEYSRYDENLGLSRLVSDQNSRASDLEVKTVSSIKKQYDVQEILPDYADADLLTGDDRMITVDIKIPRVAARVSNAVQINKMIAAFNPHMIKVVQELHAGNLKVMAEGDLVGYLAMDYSVYSRDHADALVVESKGYIFQGGGGNAYLIIYYDSDTGNIMTAREYIKKCGITEESVLAKCKTADYIPSFPGDTAVKTIYDVKFAVDNSGKVILYSEMGD